MSAVELQLYDLLKIKLGEREASSLIEYIEVKSKEKSETKFVEYKALQTKDIEILRNEIHNLFATKEDIRSTEKSIESKMSDQFKWLVGIMVTLFGLTITIMFFLIKFKQ